MGITYCVLVRGWKWLAGGNSDGVVLDDDVGNVGALLKRGGDGQSRHGCDEDGGETHIED